MPPSIAEDRRLYREGEESPAIDLIVSFENSTQCHIAVREQMRNPALRPAERQVAEFRGRAQLIGRTSWIWATVAIDCIAMSLALRKYEPHKMMGGIGGVDHEHDLYEIAGTRHRRTNQERARLGSRPLTWPAFKRAGTRQDESGAAQARTDPPVCRLITQ